MRGKPSITLKTTQGFRGRGGTNIRDEFEGNKAPPQLEAGGSFWDKVLKKGALTRKYRGAERTPYTVSG